MHWIHISDSHVQSGDSDDQNALRLRRLVDEILTLRDRGVPIDFVAHTGDLSGTADNIDEDAGSTLAAAAELERLPLPVYLLNGNHDRVAFLEKTSLWPPGEPLDGGAFRTPRDDGLLIFLNANPENGQDDLFGVVPQAQLTAMVQELRHCRAVGLPALIFVHYPTLPIPGSWMHPMRNGAELHDCLRPFTDVLVGVFSGHVHRSVQRWHDGVFYSSAPSSARHFLLWPDQAEFDSVEDDLLAYVYVSVDRYGTRVEQHGLRVGSSVNH